MKIDEELQKEIVRLYREFKEVKKVKTILGISAGSVEKYVKRAGITLNDRSYSRRCRKDIPNYTEIFPEDNKVLGYVCGLIASDGCLGTHRNIRMEIQAEDSEVLSFVANSLVKESITFKGKSRKDKIDCKDTVSFNIVLPKLYQYCLDMGITPAKSKTLDVKLDDKSEEFKWYFLRGVIDGDGSIYVGRRKGENSIRISSASPVFVRYLQSMFGGTICKSRRIENLQFKGRKAQLLAEKLPKDYWTMKRKTDRIVKILNHV